MRADEASQETQRGLSNDLQNRRSSSRRRRLLAPSQAILPNVLAVNGKEAFAKIPRVNIKMVLDVIYCHDFLEIACRILTGIIC